jgi:hypothetical protein
MIDDLAIINYNSVIFEQLFSNIPSSWDNYDSFQAFISQSFKQYLKQVPLFKGHLGDKLRQIEDTPKIICEGIEKAISCYLRGFHSDAYLQLESLLPYIKGSLANLSSEKSYTGLASGFRGRVINDQSTPPTKEDMFHIPFEKRHLVKEHRFSVQGIPAVYLGSSIYDCYVELGRPQIESLWFSYFCFSQNREGYYDPNNLKIMDLTAPSAGSFRISSLLFNIQSKVKEFERIIEEAYHQIILWPLIKACTIKRKYPNAPFQQEYIIPTLLFQLCSKSTNILGIKYDSSHSSSVSDRINGYAMQNIAIPAHNISDKGYCNILESRLILTNPISAQMLGDIVENHRLKGRTTNGLPILSDLDPALKADPTIITFDRMTMYIDSLIHAMIHGGETSLISPLYGWE